MKFIKMKEAKDAFFFLFLRSEEQKHAIRRKREGKVKDGQDVRRMEDRRQRSVP